MKQMNVSLRTSKMPRIVSFDKSIEPLHNEYKERMSELYNGVGKDIELFIKKYVYKTYHSKQIPKEKGLDLICGLTGNRGYLYGVYVDGEIKFIIIREASCWESCFG